MLRADEPVAIAAGADGAEALVLQGRPIGEPVAQYGPFVMNDEAGIEQAFADYRAPASAAGRGRPTTRCTRATPAASPATPTVGSSGATRLEGPPLTRSGGQSGVWHWKSLGRSATST